MKNYTLKAEHPDSFEIHDATDGKSFHMAKRDLGFSMLGKLSKLKPFKDGGVAVPDSLAMNETDPAIGILDSLPIPEVTEEVVIPDNRTAFEKSMSGLQQGLQGMSEFSGQQLRTPVPSAAPTSEPAPASTDMAQPIVPAPQSSAIPGANAPSGMNAYGQFQSGYNQQAAGIQKQGLIESQHQAELQKTQEEFAKSLADVTYKSQQEKFDLDVENDNLSQKAAAQKVDPRRYINNMSTGNKIMAGIAMALGGMGAAMAGQENLAYKSIQKNIENDIESQKLDMQNTDNLLSKNMQKYGNLQTATSATYLQMNALLQGQVAAIGAKYGTPMVAAKTQQLLGQLKAEYAVKGQEFQQSSFLTNLRQDMYKNGAHMDENKMANYITALPKEVQKEAREELSALQAYKGTIKTSRDLYERSKKIGSVSGNIPFTDKKAEIESIQSAIELALRSGLMKGQGSVSESDALVIKRLLPLTTDTKTQIDKKLREVEGLFGNKINGGFPVLRGYNFPINANVPKVDPEQVQKAQQWLKANEKDPAQKAKVDMVKSQLQKLQSGV